MCNVSGKHQTFIHIFLRVFTLSQEYETGRGKATTPTPIRQKFAILGAKGMLFSGKHVLNFLAKVLQRPQPEVVPYVYVRGQQQELEAKQQLSTKKVQGHFSPWVVCKARVVSICR